MDPAITTAKTIKTGHGHPMTHSRISAGFMIDHFLRVIALANVIIAKPSQVNHCVMGIGHIAEHILEKLYEKNVLRIRKVPYHLLLDCRSFFCPKLF